MIKHADMLIPMRERHYDLLPDSASIDARVTGVCFECLYLKNTFQKNNAIPVDVNNKNLVNRIV